MCTGGGGVRQWRSAVFASHTRCCPLSHAAGVLRATCIRHGWCRCEAHVRYVAQLTVPVLIQPREGIEVHRVLRVSASLYTISNTRHGHTLPRDTLGAAFRSARRLTHPVGETVCPHALALRWHRGHARNKHDRGVHPTLNGATVAARWGGIAGGLAVAVACTHQRTCVGGG